MTAKYIYIASKKYAHIHTYIHTYICITCICIFYHKTIYRVFYSNDISSAFLLERTTKSYY